jgi:hypothetical protein
MIAAWPALAAAAALAPSFPPALDAASLSGWLRQATDLAPEQVVAVTSSTVIAIVSRAKPGQGPVQLLLRAEALTPEAAANAGLLAWQMRLEVDCPRELVRVGETTGYATRIPDQNGVAVAPAKPDWSRPVKGEVLGSAWQAVCDTRFRPPLAAAAGVAQGPPQPPPAPAQAAPPAAPHAPARAPTAPRSAPPPAAPSVAAAPRRGRGAAQVVSSPIEADAQRSLAALRARFSRDFAGLETRIEPAQVRGRTVYRGIVAGFASHDEAAAFCAALKRHGADCLPR